MTDFGDHPTPTTRQDVAPQSGAVEINMVKSWTLNKRLLNSSFEQYRKNPNRRIGPLHDLATLNAELGDCVFNTPQMRATSTKLGITCFQGMELPKKWKNSQIAKTYITPIGMVGSKRGYRSRARMTEAAVLDGEIGIIVDGQFKVKNTAHMGIDAVWKKSFPIDAARNVWPASDDQRWLRAIDEGKQDLAAGEQLVLDMFTFDTEAILRDGTSPAEYMNPTHPDHWQVYRHTLPAQLRNKPRHILRYRKMTEYEETSLRTMYNTLETLKNCISIVRTAQTLSKLPDIGHEWHTTVVDRLTNMRFNEDIYGVIDNLREKIFGVNWPRFTVKEGGMFNSDVVISVSQF